jgi:hypothetical protein
MTLESPPAVVTRSSIDRVWEALDRGGFKPEKRSDKFMALCPVHGDQRRSLSVRWDAPGEKTLLHCFTCDATIQDIAAALGLSVSDTFDRPLPPRESRSSSSRPRQVNFRPPHKVPARITQTAAVDDKLRTANWERVKTYDYTDADGVLVQQVFREQAVVDGVTHKGFTQRFRNPATGRMVTRKPDGFKPVLYHHADVVDAIAAGKPVWLVEGEKDADNAAALGLVSTTNAQGAGSFPEELASVLAGGTINIIADQDTAGYKRAATLHELLTALGATVRILLPAIEDDKADLTDHLEAGLGIEQLEEIDATDASVLGRAGDVRKALAGVEACLLEINAHRTASATDANPQHLLDIETWAHESEIRFRRMLELAGGSTLFVDEYGPKARAAVDTIRAAVDQAAEIAAKAHDLAGIPAPVSIAERIKRREAPRVIDFASGSEPPVFLGNQFIRGDDGKDPNVGAEYLVRQGETVQLKRERDGENWRNRYHRILRGWAEVQSLSVDDDGTDTTNTHATHQMVVDFFRWTRDDTGQPIPDEAGQPKIEKMRVTWNAEQLRDGSWVQSLPWPGMLESGSRRGKDLAWDAIFNARPVPSTRQTVYVATGWRESETGPFFVHAGGAIAKGGALDGIATDIPGPFSPFNLPDPLEDAAELRAAWDAGTVPLVDQLPARVMAPLLGVVWQSVFERVPFITHLVGGRAAYKTSTARLACQFFAPELHFRGRREILSGANMGGTTIGLVRALATTSYVPVLIDDVAPDGNAKRAQEKLSSLARLIYNDTGRVVGRQKGGINADEPTKATVITTGELAVTGSAQTRMLSIPLDPGSLAKGSETFAELERGSARNARGQLGASLIRWIAQHRDALRAEAENFEDDPNGGATSLTRWRTRLSDLPHDAGLKDRLTEAAMTADHGIRLMLRMMRTSGALTIDEANTFYSWAEAGIYEAIAMQDSAAGDPAEQLLGYLREGLASGAGHLTAEDGTVPDNAGGIGWVVKGSGDYAQWTPSGPRLGMIKRDDKGDRVYLIPSTTIGVANQVAGRADETFSETAVSISSAMTARGWLKIDKSGKRSIGRRIDGNLMRVWDMPLNVILGADDDPTGNGDESTSTPPSSPTLFDDLHPQDSPDAPAGEPGADDEPEQHPAAGPVAPAAASAPQKPQAAAAAQLPSRAVKPAASTFRAAAAVLHTNGVWMPDGEHIELAKPIEHLGDVAKLIATLGLGHKNGWKTEDGQMFVTSEAAIELGIPVDQLPKYEPTKALKELTADHPLILGAIEAGFEVGGKERSLNATTRVWHSENGDLRGRFVLIPALGNDFNHIIDDNPDPATIARRLQRFADALGATYTISASTTGLDLMQVLHWKQREVLFAPSRPVPPAEISTLEADIEWHRTPTESEAGHQWVHAYDRGGSYLAGVSGLELGIGAPTYFPDGHDFDKRLPGYWRITMPAKGEWLTPNPIDPRNRDITGQLTWLTTPTLDVAISLGYDPEIHEAYVWEKHSRIYDTWYERIRDARTTLDTIDPDDQRARDLLKELYVRSLGLTASFEHHQGRPGFAPERYHFIQARAKANIIRRIQQIGADTGRWPVAVSKDTVLYTSDESDPIAAWPGKPEHFGRGLGQYKYEGTAPLAEHLKFLTGEGRYEGKGSLEVFI